MGVGSQDDFEEGQDFLNDTGLTELTMLWERSGVLWNLNNVRTNSAIQLLSYDLTQESGLFFFNKDGREVIKSSAPQAPWSP